MNRMNDTTLLRNYVETGSDQAFAQLVSRHFNLVYCSALRVVGGDAHLAQDVAQHVFTDLPAKLVACRPVFSWAAGFTSTPALPPPMPSAPSGVAATAKDRPPK
jgi:hypothetical protein